MFDACCAMSCSMQNRPIWISIVIPVFWAVLHSRNSIIFEEVCIPVFVALWGVLKAVNKVGIVLIPFLSFTLCVILICIRLLRSMFPMLRLLGNLLLYGLRSIRMVLRLGPLVCWDVGIVAALFMVALFFFFGMGFSFEAELKAAIHAIGIDFFIVRI